MVGRRRDDDIWRCSVLAISVKSMWSYILVEEFDIDIRRRCGYQDFTA